MTHVNQDGDLVLLILSWLIQNQREPNSEFVKTKTWKQPAKFLSGRGNEKADYTVYVYNC